MRDPVWLLPSVGRPQAVTEVLDACTEMGMTHHGVLWADGDDYSQVLLPPNWVLHQSNVNRGIGPVMNDLYAMFPNAAQYGWLADDTYPRTPQFDVLLTEAAGDWNLAYAHDDGYITEIEYPEVIAKGGNLTSGLVWGGELIRAVGWWALPGLRQAYIDVVWSHVIERFGLARYTPSVTVEHKHWRTGKRPFDKWDLMTAGVNDAVIASDHEVFKRWRRGGGMKETVKRVERSRGG